MIQAYSEKYNSESKAGIFKGKFSFYFQIAFLKWFGQPWITYSAFCLQRILRDLFPSLSSFSEEKKTQNYRAKELCSLT